MKAQANRTTGSVIVAVTAVALLVASVFAGPAHSGGVTSWMVQFGTAGDDMAIGVAADLEGNTYAAGFATAALPGQTALGGEDAFISKISCCGAALWTRQFGTASDERALAIAADGAGFVYVAGYTDGVLPGNSAQGSTDCLLAKYASSGEQLWSIQFGTGGVDLARGVAVTSAGDIYVTGYTAGSFPGFESGGGDDAFLARFNAQGRLQWVVQAGAAELQRGQDVVVDSVGHVYMCGEWGGNPTAGGLDAFVAKYTPEGEQLWFHKSAVPGNDLAYAIAVDESDSVVICGGIWGSLPGQQWFGATDAYIRKYTPAGDTEWIAQIGTPSDEQFTGIAIDSAGTIFLTGYTTGQLPGQSSAGDADILVASFGLDGTLRWLVQIGTAATDYGQQVAAGGCGRVAMTASVGGALPDQAHSGGFDAAVIGLQQTPAPRFADLNGDGVVDGADLGLLLGAWGS